VATGADDSDICLPGDINSCSPVNDPWHRLNSEYTREELDDVLGSLPESTWATNYGEGVKDLYLELQGACHAGLAKAWWCSSGNRFTLWDYLIYSVTVEHYLNFNDEWKSAIYSSTFNAIRNNINAKGGNNLTAGVYMFLTTRQALHDRIDKGWRGDLINVRSQRFGEFGSGIAGRFNMSLVYVQPGRNELYDWANLSWFEQRFGEATVNAIKNGVLTVSYHTNFWKYDDDPLIIRTFAEQAEITCFAFPTDPNCQ
jgi:hypothetical protein